MLLWFLLAIIAAPVHALPDAVVIEMDWPLNLRAAPGLDSPILDRLPPGTALTILGRTADLTWLEVASERYSAGWVFAEYVEVFIDLAAVRVRDGFSTALDYHALILDDVARARQIFERGQALGNRADVFAKVGDSITVSAHLLHPFAEGLYNLADYAYLQPAVDYFAPSAFGRTSLAAQIGWSAAVVLDPAYASADECLPGESPLVCEYRLLRPAVALIMFGTNDVGFRNLDPYRADLNRIVTISINMGVIPVLSTLPPRRGFEEKVDQFNQAVREVARRHAIPLWDYARIMALAEPYGLDQDGVHPSIPPNGYDGAADFRPSNLAYGYVLRNLSALHVLDGLWRSVLAPDEHSLKTA